MQAQVYEGYFENGKFYNNDAQIVAIPERHKVNVLLFAERVDGAGPEASREKKPFADLIGKWSGRIWMSDDFDEPLDEMKEYME